MKDLTKAEEQVMNYLWKLEKCFLKQLVEQYPSPKPAPTTVSTVVNVLVKKGFIGYNVFGKSHEYFAKVTKEGYRKFSMSGLISRYFDNSPKQFASFFTSENNLSLHELEEIQELIENRIKKIKDQ